MRKRYIQDPKTLELVPAEDYYAPSVHATMIMPDIAPYRSMITGEIIQSRSTHRTHLRDHGCIEIGNEVRHMKPPTMELSKDSHRRRKEYLIHQVQNLKPTA